MRILAVDRSTEGQTKLAERVDSFDPLDLETLDVSVNLAGVDRYTKQLDTFDVLLLGPELGEEVQAIAIQAKQIAPDIQIIIFVTDQAYASGAYRITHAARLRKVLPESASVFDLLQELVSIDGEFRACGKVRNGKVVVVAQAKGGVGATTICAALGELCNASGVKTLLWDFDIETRDLCRALTASGHQARIVDGWVKGTHPVSKRSFLESLIPLAENVSVLPPPATLAAANDLVGHPDVISLVQRIADFAKITHDNVIIDAAGKLGPAIGSLMRIADDVLLVMDDSILGLSAAHHFISSLQPILPSEDVLRILCSGTSESTRNIAAALKEHGTSLNGKAWSLPAVPFDKNAEEWPGVGKTLYSVGKRTTSKTFDLIAEELTLVNRPGLIGEKRHKEERVVRLLERRGDGGAAASVFKRVFNH